MRGLGILSDDELKVIYHQAVEIKLEKAFTDILLMELNRRGLRMEEIFFLTPSFI